jgi:hypothetical protein
MVVVVVVDVVVVVEDVDVVVDEDVVVVDVDDDAVVGTVGVDACRGASARWASSSTSLATSSTAAFSAGSRRRSCDSNALADRAICTGLPAAIAERTWSIAARVSVISTASADR